MGILFLVAILIIPYMWGCLVTGLSRDRKADNISVYVQGMLVLFIVFLGLILAGLKTDMGFGIFTVLATLVLIGVSVLGVPFLLPRIKRGAFTLPKVDKKVLPVVIAATVVGVFSILLTRQSFANDATIETVKTTLDTGKIYIFSSLDGKQMVEGLPIFNKVFVVPMLYAVLSKITFTDITIITGLIVPVITFVLNIVIMWKISAYAVTENNRNLFMYFHLILLVSGTFLPGIAIPASAGFPLLRQGYTGYAWAYGVLAPFVALMLLEKKYLRGGILFLSIFGMLKLDSIYFAFKDFSNSYHNMGASGKLWIMYLCAVFYWLYVKFTEKKKFPWELLLTGCAIIAAAICDLYETFKLKQTKQIRQAFLAWMVLASLACVSFIPFNGVKFGLSLGATDKYTVEMADLLENWTESQPLSDDGMLVVAGCEEVMSVLRAATTKVTPAYGRDFIEPLLTGYNYEKPHKGQKKLVKAMEGIASDYKEYTEAQILKFLDSNAALKTVDVMVFDKDTVVTDVIWKVFESYGFNRSNIKVKGKYQYIHR